MDGLHKHRHSGWCAWLCTCLSISTCIWMRLCLCEDPVGEWQNGEMAVAASQNETGSQQERGEWLARKASVKEVRQQRNGQEKMSDWSRGGKCQNKLATEEREAAIGTRRADSLKQRGSKWRWTPLSLLLLPSPGILICTAAYLMQLFLFHVLWHS